MSACPVPLGRSRRLRMCGVGNATAQQDSIPPFRYASHDHLRVFIIDDAAGVTDETLPIVSGRDAPFYGITALIAISHGGRDTSNVCLL